MKTAADFNAILENVYDLPLDYKEELKNLLEHNISDARREEIRRNFKETQKAQKSGKIKFSSSLQELKKML